MDLTQLEMFNAVASTGSITQAAQKVHRVPSNLTTRIRQLEADLGVELLLPRDPAGDSGTCIGLVEPDGERTFVTSPGVEQGLTDDDLASVGWRADDAVYLSGYDLVYPTTGPAVARWLAGFQAVTMA